MKRPLRIESVSPKGRRGLSLRIVDRDGDVVLGGFGYFYEETLRTLVSAANAVSASDQRLALAQLEWSDFAKKNRSKR
jgi:hypothetical protein